MTNIAIHKLHGYNEINMHTLYSGDFTFVHHTQIILCTIIILLMYTDTESYIFLIPDIHIAT